jgi:hypothetical protein
MKAVEEEQRKLRGWNTFREFLGLKEEGGGKKRKTSEWVEGKTIASLILDPALQEEYSAWLQKKRLTAQDKAKYLEAAHRVLIRTTKKSKWHQPSVRHL